MLVLRLKIAVFFFSFFSLLQCEKDPCSIKERKNEKSKALNSLLIEMEEDSLISKLFQYKNLKNSLIDSTYMYTTIPTFVNNLEPNIRNIIWDKTIGVSWTGNRGKGNRLEHKTEFLIFNNNYVQFLKQKINKDENTFMVEYLEKLKNSPPSSPIIREHIIIPMYSQIDECRLKKLIVGVHLLTEFYRVYLVD